MASLDKLEGDAVEGIFALLLIVLIAVILLAYFSLKGLDPSKLAQQVWNWLKGLIPTPGTGGGGLVPFGDYLGDNSGAQVFTGTSEGVE